MVLVVVVWMGEDGGTLVFLFPLPRSDSSFRVGTIPVIVDRLHLTCTLSPSPSRPPLHPLGYIVFSSFFLPYFFDVVALSQSSTDKQISKS